MFTPFLDSPWAWAINLSSGVVGIFAAILTTIKNLGKWQQTATSHALTAMLYVRIVMKINIELSFPSDERVAPREFLQEIQMEMFRAQSKSVGPSDNDDAISPQVCYQPEQRRGSDVFVTMHPSSLPGSVSGVRRSISFPDLPLTPTMHWDSKGVLKSTSSDSTDDTDSSESEYEYEDAANCKHLGKKFGICKEKYLRHRQTRLACANNKLTRNLDRIDAEETRVIVDMINGNKSIRSPIKIGYTHHSDSFDSMSDD